MAAMVKLHRKSGAPVFVNPQQVTYLHQSSGDPDAVLICFDHERSITVQGRVEEIAGVLDDGLKA